MFDCFSTDDEIMTRSNSYFKLANNYFGLEFSCIIIIVIVIILWHKLILSELQWNLTIILYIAIICIILHWVHAKETVAL